jgi:hypothetical protein
MEATVRKLVFILLAVLALVTFINYAQPSDTQGEMHTAAMPQ